jgi:hypothetical protein
MDSKIEKILWSIAIPGFGQLLNGKLLKGILLITLEFLINVNSHLNHAIILSFQGDTLASLNATNLQWLMFYPCVYMFAMWDTYRDAGGGQAVPYSYFLFVFPAFLGTVGVIYSSKLAIARVLIGPIWLPMILAFAGVGIGIVIKQAMSHTLRQ